MNSTSWLTILGVLAGIAEYAMSKGFYPQVAGAVLTVCFVLNGVLSKGVDKDT